MERRGSVYKVVINHEEQYSIWPADRELPKGWREERTTGTQEETEAVVRRLSKRGPQAVPG